MFHDEEPANTAIVTRYVCSWCFTTLRGGERTPRESSLMLNVNDVATMLRCSARHVWRMADARKMPRPHCSCRNDRGGERTMEPSIDCPDPDHSRAARRLRSHGPASASSYDLT